MLCLTDVAEAYEDGKKLYHDALNGKSDFDFTIKEIYGAETEVADACNCIAKGDNLRFMCHLITERQLSGRLQLIYTDPPFFSSGKYKASIRLESDVLGASKLMKLEAYDDMWRCGMKEYLTMLTARLFAMRELLSDTGCMWMHLDWHSVYYVKVIMDQIFGESNFINEVIWTYKSGGSSKRSFSKKHDTLLVYGKGKNYKFRPLTEKSYNRGMKPYRFKGVEEFCDDKGWYTLVNMKDVWSIDMVGRTSAERTGYATQKPEKLMERIIASCTDEGDLCADFFAGSGTLGAVCEKNGRRWLMCDEGGLAVADQIQRLGSLGSSFYVVKDGAADSETRLCYRAMGGLAELLSYDADMPEGLETYEEEFNKYMSGDSLSMVKLWSIGREDDSGVFRANHLQAKTDGMFEFNENDGNKTIRGYDVFGRSIRGIREE